MRKKKKSINNLIDNIPTSGPAPDEGLTTIGLDMIWNPPGHEPIKKLEVKKDDDPMLSIL
jgi:hypothetical protein